MTARGTSKNIKNTWRIHRHHDLKHKVTPCSNAFNQAKQKKIIKHTQNNQCKTYKLNPTRAAPLYLCQRDRPGEQLLFGAHAAIRRAHRRRQHAALQFRTDGAESENQRGTLGCGKNGEGCVEEEEEEG